jgi:hypothetical protein
MTPEGHVTYASLPWRGGAPRNRFGGCARNGMPRPKQIMEG